jgi:predicted TIM-barrel fold metal-dependent hydrolase
MHAISRREMLAATGLAAAAAGFPEVATAAQSGAGDITTKHIDAHSHVWSPDTAKWPLAGKLTKADLAPPSFTPEELFKVAEPEGVGRVVLIQHHIYHGWDNAYLIDCARRFPGRFAVVGMVDDTTPHPDLRMKELLPQQVKAFRITSWIRGTKDWLTGPGMASMWKCGAETGQAMSCLINPEDLPAVDAMCAKFPETPVVIDHFARIGVDGTIRDELVDQLCRLAKHKRTHAKLSAFYALGKKAPPYDDLVPMIRRVLDAFGPERCLWASDSPYQLGPPNTYAASLGLVRDRLEGLSAGDREWLLRKTAETVYFA